MLHLQVSAASPITTHREEEAVAARDLATTTLSTTTQQATAEETAARTTNTDRLYQSVCDSWPPNILHQCLKPSPKKVIDSLPVLSAFSMFASYVLLGFCVAHVGTK